MDRWTRENSLRLKGDHHCPSSLEVINEPITFWLQSHRATRSASPVLHSTSMSWSEPWTTEIAQSCCHQLEPNTTAVQALQLQYGQPHQLAQSEVATIHHCNMNWILKRVSEFFPVGSLVGEYAGIARGHNWLWAELLLSCWPSIEQLPKYLRDIFIEFLQLQGKLTVATVHWTNKIYRNLAEWLYSNAQQQRLSNWFVQQYQQEQSSNSSLKLTKNKIQTVVYLSSSADVPPILFHQFPQKTNLSVTICKWSNIHCLICWGHNHYLTQCPQIKSPTKVELQSWIIKCNRCWRCSRTSHSSVNCTLKKPCPDWSELYFQDWYAVDKQEPRPELRSLRKICLSFTHYQPCNS